MERHEKTVLWSNLAIVMFFVMNYLNVGFIVEFIKVRVLDIMLGIIYETSIFIIAGVLVLSTLYAIFLLFRKESAMLKTGVLANIFLTFMFILPGLKIL